MRRLLRLSVFDLSFLNLSLWHLALLNLFLACLVTSIFPGTSVAAKQPKLQMSEIMIPSGDEGVQLFVRNKHPAGRETSPDKILLFVHGATYPAETAFDLPIEGVSMMDLIAARGYDVYLVDVRGYGRSTRPAEMNQPPEANKPIVSTKVAARDLGAAVDYILNKRRVARINLMGWSWGTSIAGLYTSEHNDKVSRLVLYAPQWIRSEPPAIAPANATPLGAYRLVSKDQAKARWLKGVPENKQADLIPPGVFDAWATATWATDPESSKQNPPMLRAPNGVVEDSANTWSAGKALYDPGKITVPTLLLHAEWDADLPSYLAQGYFAQLKNAPYKRLVELSEGTHTVMLEKNRLQFFHELMGFLDEEKPLALK
jgi:pimeloyl-ACP methyl ester carboxylesterase